MPAARGDFTIHIEGLREAVGALRAYDRKAGRYILDGLAEAARPVADDTNRRLDRFRGVGAVVARKSVSGVFIRQSARKKTGMRADFGALQMRVGLIPAAEDGHDKFVAGVEHALDILGREENLT